MHYLLPAELGLETFVSRSVEPLCGNSYRCVSAGRYLKSVLEPLGESRTSSRINTEILRKLHQWPQCTFFWFLKESTKWRYKPSLSRSLCFCIFVGNLFFPLERIITGRDFEKCSRSDTFWKSQPLDWIVTLLKLALLSAHFSEPTTMGTLLFQWAARGCDLKRCMKIALNSDLIIATLLPQFFEKSERVGGDGGPGTTRIITLGPAITGGMERQNKERVLEYDEDAGTMTWELVDDHRYSKLQTSMKVVECSNGNDCIIHWQMEYEPRDSDTLPPEDIKAFHLAAMKAIQSYADEHHDWP